MIPNVQFFNCIIITKIYELGQRCLLVTWIEPYVRNWWIPFPLPNPEKKVSDCSETIELISTFFQLSCFGRVDMKFFTQLGDIHKIYISSRSSCSRKIKKYSH